LQWLVDLVLNRAYLILAVVLLIALISVTVFLTLEPYKEGSSRPFYFGVEFAYGSQFSQVKALVNEVKGYTNLFVIGSVLLTFNRTALDESCSYIDKSGLNFIVLITSYPMYNNTNGYPGNNTIFDWMANATKTYGSRLLGFYRYDEPGGNQLDDATFQLVKNASLSYAEVANEFEYNLGGIVNYYSNYGGRTGVQAAKIFTSDYGLYWFDYESGYSTVFGEFVGNQSRQTTIALDRGAAQSFNRPWGINITWKYDQAPFLEPPDELLSDLALAYSSGATYEVVFSYPILTEYGTLTPADLEALQTFWTEVQTNPGQFGSNPAEAAYVVPANLGFGFRSATDTIWGLFPASNYSHTAKIWNDTQLLLANYGTMLNIVYDNQSILQPTLNEYSHVFYYNQTVT
jgi:hypothetical protein